MYDAASRTVIVKSSTGENVGPSTYVVCNPRSRKQNCAPFLSSKPLSSSFLTNRETDAVYDIRGCRERRILGGQSPRNTAPRFVYKADDVPGPTRYAAKPIQWVKKKLKLDPTKPKLYACAVPYSIATLAPSIPSKLDENGYEIDENGNLLKMPPDKPVPSDINIKSVLCDRQGWRWSCRTSKRFDSKRYKTDGPGPAGYFTQVPKCRRAEEDEKYREMARLFSFVPRYVEAQEMKAAKEARPGPGAYDISLKFSPSRTKSKSINPVPFINGAPRFTYMTSDTPAPTKYKICDCSTMHKQFSTKCAPFGFDSPRFKKKKVECTPGPADYEIKGALQEKIAKKKNRHALCDPPFNSTNARDLNFASRDAPCMPSSADYPAVKRVEDDDEGKMEISSSVFMNIVCRFFSPSDKKDFVSPNKYNVADSFEKKQAQKCFNVSEVPFNVTGARSTTPAVKTGVPCSTTYKNERGLSCKGHHFAICPRFGCPEDTPGPGSYNIHPRIEHSTYKAIDTHNLKLKENVLRKKLRTAPRDTRKRWLAILKKKKLLKWFDVELDYEERMMMLIQQLFDKPI